MLFAKQIATVPYRSIPFPFLKDLSCPFLALFVPPTCCSACTPTMPIKRIYTNKTIVYYRLNLCNDSVYGFICTELTCDR